MTFRYIIYQYIVIYVLYLKRNEIIIILSNRDIEDSGKKPFSSV